MTYSYFPGCTLKNKAKDLDHYARECAKVLGFELEEIENWQCCGAVYPQASDEIATKLSSVRALADAKEKGQDLITVCSACHHVIKRVNDDMKNVEDIRTRANNYMQLEEPYEGETIVLHYLEVLRDKVGFDKLKEKVVNPLQERKSELITDVSYYARARSWHLMILRIRQLWKTSSVHLAQNRSSIHTEMNVAAVTFLLRKKKCPRTCVRKSKTVRKALELIC